MSDKLSLKKRMFLRRAAALIVAAVLLAALPACSAGPAPSPTPTETPTPARTFAPPTEAPSPTTEPTETATAPPTTAPTPIVSFPPFETSPSGELIFPQVVVDRTSAMTNEAVNFKILTSEKVNSVQTLIDGEPGRTNKKYDTDNGMRTWQARIFFTKDGSRKVQFKCTTATGGIVYVPKDPIKIDVTFNYSAESTSKNISKGKTVTFTLKTPDTIDSIIVLVDGVKQNIEYDKPDSSEGGVSVWKISITFFKIGTRAVTFEAYDGTKLKKTFPDPGITIIVQ